MTRNLSECCTHDITLCNSWKLTPYSFIDTRASKGGWLPGHRSLRADTVGIFIAGGLSPLILSDIYSPDGRWAKMGNHCFRHHNKEGDITKFGVHSLIHFDSDPPSFSLE